MSMPSSYSDPCVDEVINNSAYDQDLSQKFRGEKYPIRSLHNVAIASSIDIPNARLDSVATDLVDLTWRATGGLRSCL